MMKKYFVFALILLFTATLATAQSTKVKTASKKKKKKEESFWKTKVWYGGGFNLGFGGQQGYSVFQFGLSPMAGYKILPWLSAGPRLAPTYLSIKSFDQTGTPRRVNVVDWEIGGFLRAKIYGGVYAHGEVGNRWLSNPLFFNADPNGKIPVQKLKRTDQYVGLGYNQSNGGWGSDLSVLYNIAVANDINAYENPLTFRFGLTYRF